MEKDGPRQVYLPQVTLRINEYFQPRYMEGTGHVLKAQLRREPMATPGYDWWYDNGIIK